MPNHEIPGNRTIDYKIIGHEDMPPENPPQERVLPCHKQYFATEPDFVTSAPGRVNLIGEHTDYNDGFVLPLAINFHTVVSASKRDDRIVNAIALDENSKVEIELDAEPQFDHNASWSNYLRGVIIELKAQGYVLNGANLVISGNVPQGAGLSSSAALEIALIKALVLISNESMDGIVAARIGQAAENNFVGCNCGIMDQLISSLGQTQHALLIDCRDLTLRTVPLPKEYSVLIVNSNVKRKLVDSEYNLRRQQCEAVAKYLVVDALRDVSLEQLMAIENKIPATEFRRARHVITENQRTIDTAQALIDGSLGRVASYMAQSHASMKNDFEITVPEVDTLVNIIKSVIGEQGGARMTGGGFGGCVVSLIPKTMVSEVIKKVTVDYPGITGIKPTIFECEASSGAFAKAI